MPQSPLEGGGIRRVDLQRQGAHALQRLQHFLHHRGLVDFRKTHVDVQNLCTGVLLGEPLLQNIFDVMIAQRLLEALFPGRIDPLADQHRPLADLHCLGEGRHDRLLLCLRCRQHNRLVPGRRNFPADMFGRRPAAAADHLDTQVRDLFHLRGKLLRSHVIDRPPVLLAGQARIRVDDHGDGSCLHYPARVVVHLGGAETAVDADRIDAESLQHRDGRLDGSAGQEFSALVENQRDQHRQIAVFLRCEHGGFRLVAVAHGLDQNKVRAGLRAALHHFREEFHRPVKRKVPHRREQSSRGSDVQRHIGVLPAREAPAFHAQVHAGLHNFAQIFRVLERICPEGIGIDNVAAGLKIAAREGNNPVRVL